MTKAERNRINQKNWRARNKDKSKALCRAYYSKNRTDILERKKNSHVNYFSWRNMIQRCTNKNRADFKYYGGRGILVCDRWINSFVDFCYDMGDKPSKYHTIERKNVDGNYEPSNCCWATRDEQAKNRRIKRCG